MNDRDLFSPHGVARWVRAIVVVFMMMGLSFGTWLSRLPSVRDELGASTLQMSVYGLCVAAGSLVGLLAAGRLVERFGPRRIIAVTVVAQMIALPGAVALLLAGAAPLGLVALFAYGFNFSTTDISINVSGANAERAYRRSRMSLMHAGYSIGAVAAMAFGAAAEALKLPLQLHFIVMLSIIGLCTFAVLGRIPKDELALRARGEAGSLDLSGPVPAVVVETDPGARQAIVTTSGSIPVIPSPHPAPESAPAPAPASASASASKPEPGKRRYSPWRNPTVLLIGLITLSAGLIEGTPADWLPLALVDGRGVSNEFGTVMLGVFFGSVVAARVAGSAFLNRFGRVVVLRASFALAAAGVLTVILVPTGAGMVLGTIAWGLGTGVCWPVTISAAADNPETAVLDVAAVSAVGYTSMLLGPMVFGLIGERFGLLQAFWLLPFFAALGLLLASRTRVRPATGSR